MIAIGKIWGHETLIGNVEMSDDGKCIMFSNLRSAAGKQGSAGYFQTKINVTLYIDIRDLAIETLPGEKVPFDDITDVIQVCLAYKDVPKEWLQYHKKHFKQESENDGQN